MVKDWHYEDRRRAALEFGDCFLVVTPSGLICYVGNPDLASRLMTRRKAFVKPAEKMSEIPAESMSLESRVFV
jgi:hypothetical protein